MWQGQGLLVYLFCEAWLQGERRDDPVRTHCEVVNGHSNVDELGAIYSEIGVYV